MGTGTPDCGRVGLWGTGILGAVTLGDLDSGTIGLDNVISELRL